jgi:hypothetical protein
MLVFLFLLGPIVKSIEEICNQATCIHGDCSRNGKCICHDGWTSEYCNQSMFIEHIQ